MKQTILKLTNFSTNLIVEDAKKILIYKMQKVAQKIMQIEFIK